MPEVSIEWQPGTLFITSDRMLTGRVGTSASDASQNMRGAQDRFRGMGLQEQVNQLEEYLRELQERRAIRILR